MTDYESILICALRYALGRRSYMVGTVTRYIISEIPKLSDKCKKIMITDIEQAPYYGDDWDKEDWMLLLKKLREDIGKVEHD